MRLSESVIDPHLTKRLSSTPTEHHQNAEQHVEISRTTRCLDPTGLRDDSAEIRFEISLTQIMNIKMFWLIEELFKHYRSNCMEYFESFGEHF